MGVKKSESVLSIQLFCILYLPWCVDQRDHFSRKRTFVKYVLNFSIADVQFLKTTCHKI